MKLTPGSVLANRYRLGSLLGEGGMGQVWSATHVVTGRAVAIKRLLLQLHEERERQARARFVLEARAASAVDHPNVVEVLDFVDRENEPPLLVMELLVGETLADKLAREHSLSLAETAALLLPVVSAVGTAHSRGIVHRDLKPANIFLSRREGHEFRVKVLDFGIAKWLRPGDEIGALKTQTGSTLGTPSYMAPEQATGERDLNHKVDIWALGVILYECLSGARPVEGENAAQMLMRLLHAGIIPIEQLVADLPAELSAMIRRMLTRDREQRPDDLGGLFRLLTSLTDVRAPEFGAPVLEAPDDGVAARESERLAPPAVAWVPRTHREPAPFAEDARAAAPAHVPGSVPARRAGVAALVAGLGLVAFLAMRRDPEPPRSDAPRPEPTEALPAAPTTAEALAPAPLVPPSDPAPPLQSASTLHRAPERARASRKPALPPAAPPPSALPLETGLPPGAPCERSPQCTSKLCVAFACQ